MYMDYICAVYRIFANEVKQACLLQDDTTLKKMLGWTDVPHPTDRIIVYLTAS